jgi:hypothetical protein
MPLSEFWQHKAVQWEVPTEGIVEPWASRKHANRRRNGADNHNRAGTFTITTANMSSSLHGIGLRERRLPIPPRWARRVSSVELEAVCVRRWHHRYDPLLQSAPWLRFLRTQDSRHGRNAGSKSRSRGITWRGHDEEN